LIWNNLEVPDNPYFVDEDSLIYCADCREILPGLPKVDLVLTDPPYGINLDLTWLEVVNDKRLSNKSNDKLIGDDGSLDLSWLFDYPMWVVFGFPYIFNDKATGWLVWDKQPGLMNTERTLTSPIEMASTNIWNGFRLVRCMWAGYMRDNGEYRFEHPTQKPEKIINAAINLGRIDTFINTIMPQYLSSEFKRSGITNREVAALFPSKSGGLTGCVSNWLIGYNLPSIEQYNIIKEYIDKEYGQGYLTRDYSELINTEGKVLKSETVLLDPFLGSGTTAYCAKKLNRKCIGIEIEEKYCEIAVKRLSQSVMRLGELI